MRSLALLLAIAVAGPSVASLVCDWACAGGHKVVSEYQGSCHQGGTDASTPTMARQDKCHDLTTPTVSILANTPQVFGAVALADTPPTMDLSAGPRDRTTDLFYDLPHSPPQLLIPLRI